MICPICWRENEENWPLRMPDGGIRDGGCQDCWERQSSQEWWQAMGAPTRPKGLLYLGSPYSHQDPAVREWRFEAACQATARLMSHGILVFSPVSHSHPLTRYGLPGDWDFWQRYDREYLAACGAVAVLTLPGWHRSKGVAAEMEIARELGLPRYMAEPRLLGIDTESAPAAGTGAKVGVA